MDHAAHAGETAFRHQEIAFSVCMAAVAVLLRDNPAYSPDLLWSFAGLLAFNLGYQLLLRRKGETWLVPMVSMAANTVLVTLLVHQSGGAASPFWPMFLIPIFTACLYLRSRHVAFAALSSAAFLGSQYLLATEPGAPLKWALAELGLKASVLAASALAIAGHAFRDRAARGQLAATRAELDALTAELAAAGKGREAERDDLARFLAGLVYDLHGRLTLIRGRAGLLAAALPAESSAAQDARGIVEATGALGRLSSDLLRVLGRDAEEPAAVEPAPLIETVLHLMEYRLGSRGIRLETSLPAGLPRVRVGAPHLQQALLELLESAATEAPDGGRIAVSAERQADDVVIRLRFSAPAKRPVPTPLLQRRLLADFGVSIQSRSDDGESEYLLRLPAGRHSVRRAPR